MTKMSFHSAPRVRLQFRAGRSRDRSAAPSNSCIVEHERAKSRCRRGALAIEADVLAEMAAARRRSVSRPVGEAGTLAALIEADGAADGFLEIDLPWIWLCSWGRGILEIRHVAVRPAVEGVMIILRSAVGDLDAAAEQILGQRGDGPVAVADVAVSGRKSGSLPASTRPGAGHAWPHSWRRGLKARQSLGDKTRASGVRIGANFG